MNRSTRVIGGMQLDGTPAERSDNPNSCPEGTIRCSLEETQLYDGSMGRAEAMS